MKLKPWQEKLPFCLLQGLLTGFTWWPVTRCGFVALDDPAYVTGNAQVQAGLTREGLGWAFRTGHSANWHPLTWLSHMLVLEYSAVRPHSLDRHLLEAITLKPSYSQAKA
jgi:hypothetical protein